LENNFTQYESIILGGWIAGGIGCVICFLCISLDILQLILVLSTKKQPKEQNQTTATVIPTEQVNNTPHEQTINPHDKVDYIPQGNTAKADDKEEEQDDKKEIEEDK